MLEVDTILDIAMKKVVVYKGVPGNTLWGNMQKFSVFLTGH